MESCSECGKAHCYKHIAWYGSLGRWLCRRCAASKVRSGELVDVNRTIRPNGY